MLPQTVDPSRLAEQGAIYRDRLSLAQLPRVRELALAGDEAGFAVQIEFCCDAQRRVRVQGSVAGNIHLECQRCMRAVRLAIAQPLNLVAVWDEAQLRSVPADSDPWEASDGFDLHALVEDEILLALPMVARHPQGECAPPVSLATADRADRYRPFANLQSMVRAAGNP